MKPKKKHLKRKIVIDDIGTTYVVGELSKPDLQILICALADELDELRKQVNHFENAIRG